MTGTEAISNGVPAFKAPESLNARKTLIWMGVLLATMFMGLSSLAVQPGAAGAGVCARDRAGTTAMWWPST